LPGYYLTLTILFASFEESTVVLLLEFHVLVHDCFNQEALSLLKVSLILTNIQLLSFSFIKGPKTLDLVILKFALEEITIRIQYDPEALLLIVIPHAVIKISSFSTFQNASPLSFIV
jgi:hypothetical protein